MPRRLEAMNGRSLLRITAATREGSSATYESVHICLPIGVTTEEAGTFLTAARKSEAAVHKAQSSWTESKLMQQVLLQLEPQQRVGGNTGASWGLATWWCLWTGRRQSGYIPVEMVSASRFRARASGWNSGMASRACGGYS